MHLLKSEQIQCPAIATKIHRMNLLDQIRQQIIMELVASLMLRLHIIIHHFNYKLRTPNTI